MDGTYDSNISKYNRDPSSKAPTALTVEESDMAVGGVLQQNIDNEWHLLAFFSRQLNASERKYSIFDRELLAFYLGVQHFHYFLEGRDFTTYNDHKPLILAMGKVSNPWLARQQRHLTYGKENAVADVLSRTAIKFMKEGIDHQAGAYLWPVFAHHANLF